AQETAVEKAVQPEGTDSAQEKADGQDQDQNQNGNVHSPEAMEISAEPATVKLDKTEKIIPEVESRTVESVQSEPEPKKDNSKPRIIPVKLPELEKPARLKTQPIRTIDTGTEGNAS
ncbi:MAG TPA: hypothetical protein VJZ27_18600, partial [Aggregatilineales bacterium]|nr:hypothetical protein [Aggregatilineales bacterium]